MKLSERLNTVVSFVKPGSRVVDVGTDHGYVPIELAQRGIISHGLAMDVRKGPLERAKEHIRQYGLEDVIETRLSDGICQLQDHEADTVIVAGMGGAGDTYFRRGTAVLGSDRSLDSVSPVRA